MSENDNSQSQSHDEESAPTTAGQAEGTLSPEEQSETSPAPTQPDPAEGAVDAADNS